MASRDTYCLFYSYRLFNYTTFGPFLDKTVLTVTFALGVPFAVFVQGAWITWIWLFWNLSTEKPLETDMLKKRYLKSAWIIERQYILYETGLDNKYCLTAWGQKKDAQNWELSPSDWATTAASPKLIICMCF